MVDQNFDVCVRFVGNSGYACFLSVAQCPAADHKGYHEQNQKQYEKEFRDGCGACGNAAESQNTGDNGYDKKGDGPA